MNQPRLLIPNNTKVKTHTTLDDTTGMLISPNNLKFRKSNKIGEIIGYVPGHGGDVYWVQHGGDTFPAAYCFTEFEIED